MATTIPYFFNDKKGDTLYAPDYNFLQSAAGEYVKENNISVSQNDTKKVCLTLIDNQITFCMSHGDLFVGGRSGTGAIDDNVRIAKMIYRNLDSITDIVLTLDTHTIYQIFHSKFWIDKNGNNPEPMTFIKTEDIKEGRWKVNPIMANKLKVSCQYLDLYAEHYTKKLEDSGKFTLTIWPYHALLGGIGNAIVPIVDEAVGFHSFVRDSMPIYQVKGVNTMTENYSIFSPEVMTDHEGSMFANKNYNFYNYLSSYDVLLFAGQAMSHCFAESIEDLISEMKSVDQSLISRIYLLEDCTTPVVIPGVVDFTDMAQERFKFFKQQGVNIIKSTDVPGLLQSI